MPDVETLTTPASVYVITDTAIGPPTRTGYPQLLAYKVDVPAGQTVEQAMAGLASRLAPGAVLRVLDASLATQYTLSVSFRAG